PKPCPIRILGMAPGAELVGLKVFGQTNATTTSAFVQAIDYAVNVDHVNVLNESFGGNPFPDLRNDPISLANDNAVAAGVTVTVSSGDAGAAGTIGSPGSQAGVITVGATTQFRAYTQVNASGINLGNGGYLNNNIAALSSAGFTQLGPRTVDVVAPGDSGWALCTPSRSHVPAFSDCMNLAGTAPSSIELTGGTSESAPLTAGEAALVIQAYRSTHHGANPSPMVVKQIITSTATDLGIPATEQGAGLINSYRAVRAALSYRDTLATPSPRAGQLLITDTTAFTATAAPNAAEHFSFTVSNTGGQSQRVAPRLRTLGKTVFHASYTRYLDPVSAPGIFYDQVGLARAYIEQDFRVPAGVQRLNAAIAWQASAQPSSIVRLDLIDPSGRLAAFSDPQSSTLSSGFGQVNVRNPGSGRWRAMIWTRAAPTVNSYHGAVQLSVRGSRFVGVGSVSPPSRVVAPGHSAAFTIHVRMPARPG
ncbi:MAG: S8 family serine peptidase, partial [Chloroflexota bacterium]